MRFIHMILSDRIEMIWAMFSVMLRDLLFVLVLVDFETKFSPVERNSIQFLLILISNGFYIILVLTRVQVKSNFIANVFASSELI